MKKTFFNRLKSRRPQSDETKGWEKYCYAGEGAGIFMACLLTSGFRDSI